MPSLSRLRWYKNRLAAMSAAEILHRAAEAARKKRDRFVAAARFATAPRDYGALPPLPGLREGLEKWDIPQSLLGQWAALADAAQEGRHRVFGVDMPVMPRAALWHADPVTGKSWPQDEFCFAIDYRHDRARADIKYAWELNRLQYLQPIAALACRTGDRPLAEFCLAEIENWVDANPPFCGINWNSGIELAWRVISILVVTTLVGEYLTRAQRSKIWSSLRTHGRWIARYPSLYSSANNHRAAEALALFALGALCPHWREAARWRKTGWAALLDAAQHQILPDGAGAEQSPSYAATLLENLMLGLKIAEAHNIPVPDSFHTQILRGGEYLRWLTDAGGNQPHIGDDDSSCILGAHAQGDSYISSVLGCIAATTNRPDLAPPHAEPALRNALFGFAPAPAFAPTGLRRFPQGGLSVGRFKNPRGDILFAFDHGPLGYLSIAAHGHADALALWLHIGAQPVFVDAGTFIYHSEKERARDRGTAAHNTLALEKTDSSIQAGLFNWAHKAQARLLGWSWDGARGHIAAGHDGYTARFAALHRRTVDIAPASGAVITDRLIGPRTREAEIGFLLHPDLRARREGAEILILKGETLILRLRHESVLQTRLEPAFYAPEFGVRREATRIVFFGLLPPDHEAVTRLYWS